MGMISGNTFIRRADRLAKQAEILYQAVENMKPAGSDGKKHFDIITETDDYNVERDFSDPAKNLDDKLDFKMVAAGISLIASNINIDETHVRGQGYSSLDAYLSGNDLDVSYRYNQLRNAVRGDNLLSVNVFGPENKLGTFSVSSGNGSYTRLSGIGTGLGTAGDGNYCATKVVAKVVGNNIGTNDLVINLTMKRENLSTFSEQITVPAGSQVGTEVESANKTIDITNVNLVSGNNGDNIEIWSKELRTIAL